MTNLGNWDELSTEFKTRVLFASQAVDLMEFSFRYNNAIATYQQLITIVESLPLDQQPQSERLLIALYARSWKDAGGIPNWDKTFDSKDSYSTYENYYQRYGCQDSESLISWDDTNVLVEDGISLPQVVTRPDVLMASLN